MSNQRKKAQHLARQRKNAGAVLRQHGVCVVNLNHPENFQTTFSYKSGKMVPATQSVGAALCDVPHRWTIYYSVFCDTGVEKYVKTESMVTGGIYLSSDDRMTELIRSRHVPFIRQERRDCVTGSGWIALPYDIELTQEQEDRLYDAAREAHKHYGDTYPRPDYDPFDD